MDEDAARKRLANGGWKPSLALPEIPPGPYAVSLLDGKPATGRVLVVDSRKAAARAEELLLGHYTDLVAWPDGEERWELEPLRGREVLLWPGASADAFCRLEAVLADPRGLACTGKVVEGLDLTEWAGTAEELIAAARQKRRVIVMPEVWIPSPESPVANAEPPPPSDIDFPPEASTEPPKRRRGKLRVVGGADIPDPEEAPLPAELSEAGVAAHFVSLHRNKYRTVFEWSGRGGPCWMTWDGSRWRREPNRVTAMQDALTLGASVKQWSAARAIAPATQLRWESKKFLGAVLDLASYAPAFVSTPALWDADPYLLGTPAGTVDLRSGKLLEPDPEDHITRQTTVSPEPGHHPLFDDVIRRAAGGEDDIVAYLWRWLGYLCSGSTKEKAFLYLYGKTDSGKTTLANAIANILGNADDGGYAAQCDIEMFTDTKLDKGNDRLAHLAGARFAYASEMEEGKNFKSALLKLATGGDTLAGRFLYAEKFSFTATHKLWIFGNHQMHMKSNDAALLNRLHLLEYKDAFIVTPEERDNDFPDKLRAEYPAILASMIRACVNYLDQGGLGRPERIAASVEEYASNEDTLAQWIAECLDQRPDSRTPAAEAYESFRKWAEKEGAFAPSAKRFRQQMTERGFGKGRDAKGRYFSGFTLRVGSGL